MDYETVSAFFKAMGNPTRLKILAELAKNERCVGDVESLIGSGQANISQHLAILKRNGIVDCRKEGNVRCYFLRQPSVVKNILETVAMGE
ncbi:MAG: winged helix-turn-helix transcriptional regulator [Deltaproteobacteria bacterium]|nr:winged helix-turn-helix transcriptional regulator [Deltaproteobacteria bacterium]